MGERLFTAVVPPVAVIDELGRWVDPRRDDAWRWTDASDWHVTLAFYADVEPWRYDELVERLGGAADRTRHFSLSRRSRSRSVSQLSALRPVNVTVTA